MTRRRLLVLGSVIAVLFTGAWFALDSAMAPIFGSAPNKHPEIQAALVRAAEKAGVGGTVSLADVELGPWDTVYIWDGYTADREHVVFPKVDFGDGGYGTDYVVAFSNAGDLVAWVRFNINDPLVYFDPPGTGIRASRTGAVFAVTRHPDFPDTKFLLVLK